MRSALLLAAVGFWILIAQPAQAHVLSLNEATSALMGNPGDNDITEMWNCFERKKGWDVVAAYKDLQNRNGDHHVDSFWIFQMRSGYKASVWFHSWHPNSTSTIYDTNTNWVSLCDT